MPEIATPPVLLAVTAALAYLLGAVPFGIVVSRAFGLGDPRNIGSGNIGATNVLRTGNKPAAAMTLLLDAGKGAIAVLIARSLLAEDAAQLAGAAAFIGHLFPVYLRFKGGKGVATFLGTLLALAFPVGAAACGMWLLAALASRISSLSALVAAASAPLVALIAGYGHAAGFCALLAVLIFISHRANIGRLLAGAEPRIGKR